jgi:hypothetical protein
MKPRKLKIVLLDENIYNAFITENEDDAELIIQELGQVFGTMRVSSLVTSLSNVEEFRKTIDTWKKDSRMLIGPLVPG